MFATPGRWTSSSIAAKPLRKGQLTPAVTLDPTILWRFATRDLRGAMDDATYDLWIAPLEVDAIEGQVLRLRAPDAIRAWVQARLRRVIEDAVGRAAGSAMTVEIVGAPLVVGASSSSAAATSAGDGLAPGPGLNPKFTFEQFVIGDANRFAHAAGLTAGELPGQAYNPLFLYGAPGVGKTHLLHAIGNYVTSHEPSLTVRCTTAEHFTNDFLGALQANGIDRFKARYRRVDLLLIDDVQFLERKVKTEEEFFHTFNALRDAGVQVVLTSDRLPRDMLALEDRLRERFESGLVAQIDAPDPATRMTILRKRAALDGIHAEDGVLEQVSERVTTSVRALEAALIRVVAFASLTGKPLTEALTVRVLNDLYPARVVAARQEITVDSIIDLVAGRFSLTAEELRSSSRSPRIAWPRQLAMFLAREHTHHSLPAIARAFGTQTAHTTVLHAHRRTRTRLEDDPESSALARDLSAQLNGRRHDRSE